MGSLNNLSKTFRYVNELGGDITFTYDYGYLISKPTGIDTVSISLSRAQGINQVGATIQSKNVQPRAVIISGIIVGEDQMTRKENLLGIIRPDLSGRLYADDYYIEVYPTATPSIEPKPQFARFEFSVLAPYPYWCKDINVQTEMSTIDSRFRLSSGLDENGAAIPAWNISGSYQFGNVNKVEFTNIPNNGEVSIPFTVVFTAKGSVTNPKILNAYTNEYLKVNKEMSAGEIITVQITHSRTYVVSSVDGDIRGCLSLASKLYRLAVGDNVLKPTADSGSENLEVSLAYATEIVGIAL